MRRNDVDQDVLGVDELLSIVIAVWWAVSRDDDTLLRGLFVYFIYRCQCIASSMPPRSRAPRRKDIENGRTTVRIGRRFLAEKAKT